LRVARESRASVQRSPVANDPVSSALAIYPGGEAAMLTGQALDAEVFALFKRATAA